MKISAGVGGKQWWAGQEETNPSASLLIGQQQAVMSVAVSQFSKENNGHILSKPKLGPKSFPGLSILNIKGKPKIHSEVYFSYRCP